MVKKERHGLQGWLVEMLAPQPTEAHCFLGGSSPLCGERVSSNRIALEGHPREGKIKKCERCKVERKKILEAVK